MFISFHLALCNVNDKRWRSALLQFCLACLAKFTHTSTCTYKHSHLFRQEQYSRNPGATTARLLCKTFIIYDVFDVVICINIRGILIRLKQLKKKKKFSLFKELFLPKEKVAMRSVDSSNTTPFHWGKKKKSYFISFFFNALLIFVPGFYRGYLMAQLVTAPQCPIQSAKESIFIDQCLCKAYR